MKADPGALVGPVVALLLLALIVQQTLGALREAGAWGHHGVAVASAQDPYARLDRALAGPDTATAPARDPFRFGASPAAPVATRHPATAPPAPKGPPPPLLTAIIFDSDPRATIRYDGRDYPVRVNSLFADFRVVRIAADEVVLDRSGETLILKLPSKGE